MMKTTTLGLIALLLSQQALAYTKIESFSVTSPRNRLQQARQEGLGISALEARQKKDILKMKSQNPQKYQKTNEFPNRLLTEAEEGFQKVDPAKTLAKLYLMRAIEKNWGRLSQMAFLDTPTDDLHEARRYIKEDLERIAFVPTPSKTHYRFEVPWGAALVSKNLKNVEISIRVADHLEGNTPPEGSERIRIPEDQ